MINSKEIQSLYNDFYIQIRKYIWPVATVELLADFEVECYKAFPDLQNLQRIFNRLRVDILSTAREDEEFKKMIDKIDQFISENAHKFSDDEIYYKLNRVQEVV